MILKEANLVFNLSCIKIVDQYKYLGTMIKSNVNTEVICKRGQHHSYYIRRMLNVEFGK